MRKEVAKGLVNDSIKASQKTRSLIFFFGYY